MHTLSYIDTYLYAYDANERAILAVTLQQAGMVVYPQSTVEAILEQWPLQPANLFVAALPTTALVETMVIIRQVTGAPVILLLEPVNEDMQVALYAAGADLVLLRPYSPRLLLAQAHNLAYRGNSVPLTNLPTLQIGDLQVNPTTRSVSIGGKSSIPLTQREFQLFYLLYTHAGQPLTFDQIIEAIWGYTGQGDKNLLRSLIHRLRLKLEGDGEVPTYIQSIPGIGYQFIGDFQM